MVEKNRSEYGYHLFAYYHNHDDARFIAEFFEHGDYCVLEARIRELLIEEYHENEIYVVYGQGKTFTTTKEIITEVKLQADKKH